MNLYTKQKQTTDIGSKLMDNKGKREGGRYKLGVWD